MRWFILSRPLKSDGVSPSKSLSGARDSHDRARTARVPPNDSCCILITSVPGSRDAPRRETNHQFGSLKSLPRKSIKIWLVKGFSIVISPPGHLSVTKVTAGLLMLWLVRLTPLTAASAVPPAKLRGVAYLRFWKHCMVVPWKNNIAPSIGHAFQILAMQERVAMASRLGAII